MGNGRKVSTPYYTRLRYLAKAEKRRDWVATMWDTSLRTVLKCLPKPSLRIRGLVCLTLVRARCCLGRHQRGASNDL